MIGNTSLVHLSKFSDGLPGHIIAKLEGYNPGWCVKDRIGLSMIETAEKDGSLPKGGTIIEPTSGNTGIGLAMTAAVKGYKIILTMPSSMSVERRKLLINLGAELVLTDANKGMLGAIEEAEMLTERIPGSFMPQQFNNPASSLRYNRSRDMARYGRSYRYVCRWCGNRRNHHRSWKISKREKS
jgi:cysteine synthase